MSDLVAGLHDLQRTLVREHLQAPGLFGEISRMEGLLADTYRNRVPYELLQNSDDAGSTRVDVVEDDSGVIRWSNDGRLLNAADIEALCRSASSTKMRGGGSIGYRGIGFKSLAAIATRIEVRSGRVGLAFDRRSAAELLGEADPAGVPLIRVPTEIEELDPVKGASFTVSCRPGANAGIGQLHPGSLLFLRHVERLVVESAGRRSEFRITRHADEVVLRLSEGDANFQMIRKGAATVAIPMNARALALTGVRGRLACFLPLDDELGLPVVVSGDLLTDPSRTHAVIADESTRQVLGEAASAIARELRSPGSPVFERLWELLLEGEDIRSLLLAAGTSASSVLLGALRDEMLRERPAFSWSSLPLEPEDVNALFPTGAPAALYTEANQTAARAVRTALGLETLDVAGLLALPEPPVLSGALRSRLGRHVTQLAQAHGRPLTPVERALVEESSGRVPDATVAQPAARPPEGRTSKGATMAAVLARWRTAEVATMEFLNGRGWDLRDVSGQNVGFDLEGTDPSGQPVRIEVKKVDHPDARFAMTNNEMSLMLSAGGGYLLAVLVGDGRHVRLLMLDPTVGDLPRERVCRRWDWEFTDWFRFATALE